MKHSRSKQSSLFCLVLLYFLMQSCDSCPGIDYPRFDDRPPQIHITKRLNECSYTVDIHLVLGVKPLNSQGVLHVSDSAFLVSIPELGSEQLPLFDFSRKSGEQYSIEDERFSRLSVDCKVDSIYRRNDGDVIYAFRIQDSFVQDSASGNIVFFVSRSKGIIGSYISINLPDDGSDYDEIFGPGEKYLDPRGDYLTDLIDYTKKSKVKIL